MKNTAFTLLFFALFALAATAQAPQAFKYQAVVRDAAGQVLPNQTVGLRIRLTPANTATIVYAETHTATTNAFGLVNLNVGRGTVVSGQFGTIDWEQPIYIHLGLDINGGAAYEEMGFSELLSVPYALYAANGGDVDPTNELEMPANPQKGDIVYYDGTNWQRLPKGKGGQVLTLHNDGTPAWNGPGTDDLLEVALPNGEILYVSPVNQSLSVRWGSFGTDITALANITTSAAVNMDFNGQANTDAIVAQLGAGGTDYAAKVCADLVAYGFDDWYLPAAGELNEMNQQLGLGGSGEITNGAYWSSSEYDANNAWYLYFDGNGQGFDAKNLFASCRCVRR